MALTQTDLDNLDAAIATGELRVEFNGRVVIYRSVEQLLRARQHVYAVLTGTTPSTPAPKRTGTYSFNFKSARGD